jgi:hypothetical protein
MYFVPWFEEKEVKLPQILSTDKSTDKMAQFLKKSFKPGLCHPPPL